MKIVKIKAVESSTDIFAMGGKYKYVTTLEINKNDPVYPVLRKFSGLLWKRDNNHHRGISFRKHFIIYNLNKSNQPNFIFTGNKNSAIRKIMLLTGLSREEVIVELAIGGLS